MLSCSLDVFKWKLVSQGESRTLGSGDLGVSRHLQCGGRDMDEFANSWVEPGDSRSSLREHYWVRELNVRIEQNGNSIS